MANLSREHHRKALRRVDGVIELPEGRVGVVEGPGRRLAIAEVVDGTRQIRRRNVLGLVARIDTTYILPCKGPGCWMNINVTDKYGNPIPGVRVGAWKGGKSGDEMLNNRYTDLKGNASIPLTMQTPGTLYYSLKDDSGNNAIGQVIVK